jgi:hypothetical protein
MRGTVKVVPSERRFPQDTFTGVRVSGIEVENRQPRPVRFYISLERLGIPIPFVGDTSIDVVALRLTKAFFDCWTEIYKQEQNTPMPAISDETMLYWREAVGNAPRSEQT